MRNTQPRKVLFLLDCLYGDAGGGTERQFMKLYRRHSEIAITPYVAFLRDAIVHHRIQWAREPLLLNLHSLRSFVLPWKVLMLTRYLKSKGIGVVHTWFDDAAIVGLFVKVATPKIRLITSQRNLGHSHGGIKKHLLRKTFHKSDRIVVNSSAIVNFLASKYDINKEKIRLIRNIYEGRNGGTIEESIEELEVIRARHKYLAVVVANLREVKGIDDIIAAAATTKGRINVGYVLIGGGSGIDRYQEQLRIRGLTDTVYLLGYKNNVFPYLQAADLAILPSRTEGSSNALIEYMFAGLPIIATDVEANRETLHGGRYGTLVPPQNPNALARAILDLTDNIEVARDLGETVRRSVQQEYDVHSTDAQYRSLYYE